MVQRKPKWLTVPLPGGLRYKQVKKAVSCNGLSTVCQEARCPNIGECWNSGTATFMILGDTCTRGCEFCAVSRGNPNGALDFDEPRKVANAAAAMGLNYVVVTSVTRDDLEDGGARIFASTVREIKDLPNAPLVELLTPDYTGQALELVLAERPTVFAHNIEVVERLSQQLRHNQFTYSKSLECLYQASRGNPDIITKSSIMLGLGETDSEIRQSLQDLRDVNVSILVIGQYLQPTSKHAPVLEFVEPHRFDELAAYGKSLGFEYVAAGPLVRTSYKAAEAFVKSKQEKAVQ